MSANVETEISDHLSSSSAAVIAFGPTRRGVRYALRATGLPGLLLLAIFLVAVVGSFVTPKDPDKTHPFDIGASPFHHGYLLGSDQVGRDTLSRLIAGAHLSLMMGIPPVIIAGVIGIILSLMTAFGPRALDFGIMRIVDVFLALPAVLLALSVAAVLGPSLPNTVLALVIVLIPPITRIAREAALDIRSKPYLDAARMSGASRLRLMRDVVLPNMFPTVLVYCAALAGLMIVAAAALSFIGVGVQPPTAEWGRIVADGRTDFLVNPWPPLLAGACIFLTSLALNLTADRLRTYFDPRSE